MTESTNSCSVEFVAFKTDRNLSHLRKITSLLAQQISEQNKNGDPVLNEPLLQEWVQLFVTLDNNIDPAFRKNDPAYRFTMHVPAPSSLTISDAQTQAQYASKVESNRKRAEQSLFQVQIRSLENKASWMFAGFVLSNYCNNSRSAQFKDLITGSPMSEQRKQSILKLQSQESLR